MHPALLLAAALSLPEGPTDLPPGPGVQAVRQNCLACHSAEMLLTQPSFPRATWEAEVAKMRKVYKAPVPDADVAPIVTYLTTKQP